MNLNPDCMANGPFRQSHYLSSLSKVLRSAWCFVFNGKRVLDIYPGERGIFLKN